MADLALATAHRLVQLAREDVARLGVALPRIAQAGADDVHAPSMMEPPADKPGHTLVWWRTVLNSAEFVSQALALQNPIPGSRWVLMWVQPQESGHLSVIVAEVEILGEAHGEPRPLVHFTLGVRDDGTAMLVPCLQAGQQPQPDPTLN